MTTMDTSEIQERIDAIRAAMTAKGLGSAEASFTLRSDQQHSLTIQWANPAKKLRGSVVPQDYEFIRGDDPVAMLEEADAFVAAMPGAEETKQRQFMSALGEVIDLGRQSGIEVSYVNPLVETMKRLSENIITYQPAE